MRDLSNSLDLLRDVSILYEDYNPHLDLIILAALDLFWERFYFSDY